MLHAWIALLALAAPSTPPPSCTLVYGRDWAFIAQTPPGWRSACGDRAFPGTAMSMQPADLPVDSRKVLMYVSVSGNGHEDLATFVKTEIGRYRNEASRLPAGAHDRLPMRIGAPRQISPTRILVHIAHAAFDRDELIEYVKGPSAFYMVVLSSDSTDTTAQYRPDFQTFLKGFSPASVEFQPRGPRPGQPSPAPH